ncbi:MAG TPA: winged helix-turn-helix domain-containing protein [Mycobacteriales bacterium]|jgi:hypothetical protein|nr:winged helix-turn-helix domain-containing protein [Mycobacteriales bacterium]
MSISIDVDADVFECLKAAAEPFVDTPNTVLRRLLGLDHQGEARVPDSRIQEPAIAQSVVGRRQGRQRRTSSPKRTRAASGTLLPEERYERPLLKALVDAGGQAPYREIVDAVGREMKDELMPADFENLTSGAVRWQSRLQFVRLRLIERGYLIKDAPRGIWAVTDAGRAVLAEAEAQ